MRGPTASVELAPHHKMGLPLPNPVLLGCGVVGLGDALAPGMDLYSLGGFVTAPISHRPRRRQPPRVVEVSGGLLWDQGGWTMGVQRALREYGDLWRRSPVPVIVHVAGSEPGHVAPVAAALEGVPGVAALEIDVPDGEMAPSLVWALREAADLPVLARLPLTVVDDTVRVVIDAGADALVVAQPPPGLHFEGASGQLQRGGFHGPGLASLIAARMAALVSWVRVPVVAAGGVWSVPDALGFLAAGAAALQVDLAVWLDPSLPSQISQALAGASMS